ncbi:MnmC family methyltransferase [Fluviispira vulneris]|uniref:MnmC family methyltransferase n=1 Tax=Fluviispira vulneris TaxID=2763012 RepID=UPI0016470FFB|nr:MnmC family methyltransferase [Fluviispira vulneris]
MPINDAGNKYALVYTESGIPTFRHLATQETLHGQVGPYEEAQKLYVESSAIQTKNGKCIVYDIGMGCGAQLIAMFHAFLANKNLTHMTIVSFDLEKEGLVLLWQNKELFPYINQFTHILPMCLEKNHLLVNLEDGRLFEWIFIQGDFVQTLESEAKYPYADIICYDFFSPASHPQLWTYNIFSKLRERVKEDSLLITYSSATCIRAALLASGFFVGMGIASGKKARSTLASPTAQTLKELLPPEWKNRFARSQAQFSSLEKDENKAIIKERIATHSQWDL